MRSKTLLVGVSVVVGLLLSAGRYRNGGESKSSCGSW